MVQWNNWRAKFMPSSTIPTKDVLGKVLHQLGHQLATPTISWEEYLNLRKKAGLIQYGKSMQTVMSEKTDNDKESAQRRLANIDLAKAALDEQLSNLNAQELYTIWCMELTDTWFYTLKRNGRTYGRKYVTSLDDVPAGERAFQINRPNHAFNAMTGKHSAIMRLLGFTQTEGCNWMEDTSRLNRFVGWCRKQENPYLALTTLIRGNKGHSDAIVDENGEGIPLGCCPDCVNKLTTKLVRSIREDKNATEEESAKSLIVALRDSKHEPLEGFTPEKDTSFIPMDEAEFNPYEEVHYQENIVEEAY